MPTPAENHELARCHACGPDNPHGFRLRFRREGAAVVADVVCRPEWLSWRGVVHGGVLTTWMDEAMGWAVAQDGWTGLTGRLRVRFARPVGPGQALRVRAWVLAYRHRVARAAAEVVSPGGVRVAEAEGLLRLGQVVPPVEALP